MRSQCPSFAFVTNTAYLGVLEVVVVVVEVIIREIELRINYIYMVKIYLGFLEFYSKK